MNFYVVVVVVLQFIVIQWLCCDVVRGSCEEKCGVDSSDGGRCEIVKIGDEGEIKQIGKWKHGCRGKKYVQGVCAENPGETFCAAKCCGEGHVLNTTSWEIRDVQLLIGGKKGEDEFWSIECPLYSVITGFRMITDKDNYRMMSSVRCTLLDRRVFNAQKCKVLDFEKGYGGRSDKKKSWTQTCDEGYGLVGLYVKPNQGRGTRTTVNEVHKGKCCELYQHRMQIGWRSDFTHNFAGFAQLRDSHSRGIGYRLFKLRKNGSRNSRLVLTPDEIVTRGMLISPNLKSDLTDVCFRITTEQFTSGNGSSTTLKIWLRYSGSERQVNAVHRSKPSTGRPTHYDVYLPTAGNAQLLIDVSMDDPDGVIKEFVIQEMKFLEGGECKFSSCRNDTDCRTHEVCGSGSSTHRHCRCSRNYKPDSNGICSNHTTQSGSEAKRPRPTHSSRPPKTTAKPGPSGGKPVKPQPPLVIYSIAGSAVGVILVVIGLSVCLCYRNSISGKHRRMNSFEQEMSIVHRTNQLLSVTSSSKLGQRSMFRPYMVSLGCVENLSTSTTDLSSNMPGSSDIVTPPNRYLCIDASTGEPVYTQISKGRDDVIDNQSEQGEVFVNRNVESETEEVEEEVIPPHGRRKHSVSETVYSRASNSTKERGLSLASSQASTSQRRASYVTLLHPVYGDSDSEVDAEEDTSDTEEESSGHFFIPGDDEEDLIGELTEISHDVIKISPRVIGQGAFGVVKYGTLLSVKGSQEVAIKMLKQRSGNELSKEDRVRFYQEAVIWGQFDHVNVVALFGVLVTKQPCMVLEYMSRGNLSKYLSKVRRIRHREGVATVSREMQCVFLKMARDIVHGMCYLASFKFVHRDLAARNILLAENKGDLICKISDFGLSRHFIKDEDYYTSHGGHIPIKWTAPEALTLKKYSTASDVWSYAIVLWEIWSFGQQPYDTWSNEKVQREVCDKAYRLPAPDAIPSLLYRLMVDCWHPDKSQRPTFPKLRYCLSHSDSSILGKGCSKRSERSRSNTFSSEDGESALNNEPVGESQNTY